MYAASFPIKEGFFIIGVTNALFNLLALIVCLRHIIVFLPLVFIIPTVEKERSGDRETLREKREVNPDQGGKATRNK